MGQVQVLKIRYFYLVNATEYTQETAALFTFTIEKYRILKT